MQLLLEGPKRQLPVNIQSQAIIGPPAKRKKNAVLLAGNTECWFGSFVIFQGEQYSKGNLYLCGVLEGWGAGMERSGPPPTSLTLDPHNIS